LQKDDENDEVKKEDSLIALKEHLTVGVDQEALETLKNLRNTRIKYALRGVPLQLSE
jgi:hypothetical protein